MTVCGTGEAIHPRGYWLDEPGPNAYFDRGLADALADFAAGGSVLDLGCGEGRYVGHLRKKGLSAEGYDGNPRTTQLSGGMCGIADLSSSLRLPMAEWVLCLEVGEHVPRQFEQVVLDNVTRHAKRGAIISWAVPGQGGRGHCNQRSPEWLGRALESRGFREDRDAGDAIRTRCELPWFRSNIRVFHKLPIPARPPRHPVVRAAFLTPSLRMGGAERWMISLARASDRNHIRWVGTALSPGGSACPDLALELSAYMPIYGDHRGDRTGMVPGVTRTAPPGPVWAATREADVLVAWGVPRLSELMRGLDVPVVYVSHGAGKWSRQTVRGSEARANHLVGVSRPALSAFSTSRRSEAVVIHNGIDVRRCTPRRSREQTRAAWGLGPNHRIIGYVGRYSPEKNPTAAARAVALLGGEYVAVHAGDGWAEAEVRSAVSRIAGERGRFLPREHCVGNVLVGLDVLVLASPSEGFSLSIAEAWYCGVPVVATRVGAIPELENQHGPLVSPVPIHPTPGELARAIRVALGDAHRREVVPRAREAVREFYTSAMMTRRWTEYLRSIVFTSM